MGCLLCEWMWIFSVRLFRCRVLEKTVTAGMVSLMFGGGFCGFGYSGIFSLFFEISCSRRGLACLRGFCYVFVCVYMTYRLIFLWTLNVSNTFRKSALIQYSGKGKQVNLVNSFE